MGWKLLVLLLRESNWRGGRIVQTLWATLRGSGESSIANPGFHPGLLSDLPSGGAKAEALSVRGIHCHVGKASLAVLSLHVEGTEPGRGA